MRKNQSMFARVAALLESGVTDAKEIARRTGFAERLVQTYRSRWKRLPHYRDVQKARRRRLGIRSREQYKRDLSKRRAALLKKVNPLLARGLSREEIAARIGTTKNAVCGLVWRQSQQTSA